MPTGFEWVQIGGILVAVASALWGFYSGWLPRWIKSTIGFYELRAEVENVKENTEQLEAQHAETMAEITTLKHGQVALAEAVENEHNTVAVEELREAHFGDRSQPGDFLRDDSPYGDD